MVGNLVYYTIGIALAYALKDNRALPKCLVKRMYYYSVGGPTVPSNQRLAFLNYVNEEFATHEYRLQDLLRTIVQSDAFSRITMPADAELAVQGGDSDVQQVALSEIADAVGNDPAPGEER